MGKPQFLVENNFFFFFFSRTETGHAKPKNEIMQNRSKKGNNHGEQNNQIQEHG